MHKNETPPVGPVTGTVEATDFAKNEFSSTASAYANSLRWTNNGAKVITVTLTNEMGRVRNMLTVHIGPTKKKVYMPTLNNVRNDHDAE